MTFTAVVETVTAPELIAMQQPVVVEPVSVPVATATTTAASPVASAAARGGSVKCYLCDNRIPVAEIDPRCVPEQPMCKVCLVEFETFLPPVIEGAATETPPPIVVTSEAVGVAEEPTSFEIPVVIVSPPSPMEAADVFKPEEQPFLKEGWLYLTARNGRIIVRAGDWVALEALEEPGMVRIHVRPESQLHFDVVGTPEHIWSIVYGHSRRIGV